MRYLVYLLILTGLLAAAFVAAAPHLIGTDTFKKQLTQKISQATGYNISISGKIQIKFFPFIGAHLNKINIQDAIGSPYPLIEARSLAVEVKLLPLLRREIVVKRLVLKNPGIHLYVNSAGKKNWQLPPVKAEANAAASTKSAPKASSFLPQDILLSDVSIENGSLSFTDDQQKKKWVINALNLDVSLTETSLLTFRGNGEWNGQTVKVDASIDKLEAFFRGQPAKIRGNVNSDLLAVDINGAWEKEVYTGVLNARIIYLRDFMSWINPGKDLSGHAIPSQFGISGDVQCGLTYCHAANAAIRLDTIRAGGSIKADWAGKVPQLELDLTAGQVDVNLFLPAEKIQISDRSWLAAAEADEDWSREPLDFSALSALNAIVKLRADGFLIRNVAIGKAAIDARLQNGRLSFSMPDADFYNGRLSVTGSLESIGKSIAIEERWDIANVQISPLLQDALNDDRLSGTLDLSLRTERSGKSLHDMAHGVSGSGQIKITDGAFRGFNIAEMARNVKAAFRPVEKGAQKTDFSEVTGTFIISYGVINSNDLVMRSPFLRVTGKGKINMPLGTIDARLLPQLVDTAQGQGGKDKQALLAVPIIVEGLLRDPVFRPDVKSVVRDAIQNPDKMKQQLRDGKDALKGLFRKLQ